MTAPHIASSNALRAAVETIARVAGDETRSRRMRLAKIEELARSALASTAYDTPATATTKAKAARAAMDAFAALTTKPKDRR